MPQPKSITGEPRPQESTRVIISDLWPRRLLETGSGEEHLQCHVAELGLGLPSKRSLGQGGRREIGAVSRPHREAAAKDSGSSFVIAAARASSVRPRGSLIGLTIRGGFC
jgi:hypothetical protein